MGWVQRAKRRNREKEEQRVIAIPLQFLAEVLLGSSSPVSGISNSHNMRGLRISAESSPELFFNGMDYWGIPNKIPVSRAARMIDIPLKF